MAVRKPLAKRTLSLGERLERARRQARHGKSWSVRLTAAKRAEKLAAEVFTNPRAT